MPRGVPLTPEQTQKLAEIYARTGNFAEAARQVGVDEKTARRRLAQMREPERARLHARACERGIRTVRGRLTRTAERLEGLIANEVADGPGMEPRDYAALCNALSKIADTLVTIAEHSDRRANARLNREKTKAELAALKAAGAEGGEVQVVVQIASPVKKEGAE